MGAALSADRKRPVRSRKSYGSVRIVQPDRQSRNVRAMATDRFAVVTGTTSGIGFAVARALVDRGWRVLGIASRPSPIVHDRYEHTQLDLHDIGALDVRVGPRLTSLLRKSSFRRIGLVNNAADPGLLGPVAALDARRLPGVLTTNVAAPV